MHRDLALGEQGGLRLSWNAPSKVPSYHMNNQQEESEEAINQPPPLKGGRKHTMTSRLTADSFDCSIFPLSLSKSGALALGGRSLDATVEEVLSTASMCTSLNQSKDFAKTTQLRYTESVHHFLYVHHLDSSVID